ncbi:AbrB family transcriptional regulator [Pseudomonas sp. ZM23]|uniref:AbrB family transcriptional regulator n=1 Tax=Pseudomonas triclosanedens TaxID=2961893 RepID=A0ABY7A1M0_9PSED|nr:AbrB family transcriptional regulator [Pseudomonas triclosanedens]MCP8464509.1 AbrB family transcriptional regulator [Pseudomonas triclosanedens]MCP8471643.1 AbrB family transcriptional regulator [Pseudomonas triclosanedens]MCP8477545.1 AbrB family transcriptional regulator [Pseudomonas triclosanedens]WAI51008.1 AbrB family transcriptional regulator [Pseudomonas triclosanedens]
MRNVANWRLFWATPLIGAIGGWLASLVGWPLPWMIGSLLAVMLSRCLFDWQLAEVPGARKAGQWVVGTGIGLHFTPAVVEQVLNHGAIVVIGALATTLSSLAAIVLLRRAGEDRATAFFASMPGGASEMVNLGLRHGAQSSRVAAAQSLRLLLVVLLVPAAFAWLLETPAPTTHASHVDWSWLALLLPAGALVALLWQKLRQPNPWLLGPLLVSAIAAIAADLQIGLPAGSSSLGQWLIGSALGCHFNRSFFRSAPAFVGRSLVCTLWMMLVAALVAELIGWLGPLDHQSLMLGMMPGGIAELSLTAEALQLSVPLVTALQVLRLLLVLFLAEPCFRLWQRRAEALE